MASANVPPQGGQTLVTKHDQMQMGERLQYEKDFIIPLAFEMQMVRTHSPNETLPIHLL